MPAVAFPESAPNRRLNRLERAWTRRDYRSCSKSRSCMRFSLRKTTCVLPIRRLRSNFGAAFSRVASLGLSGFFVVAICRRPAPDTVRARSRRDTLIVRTFKMSLCISMNAMCLAPKVRVASPAASSTLRALFRHPPKVGRGVQTRHATAPRAHRACSDGLDAPIRPLDAAATVFRAPAERSRSFRGSGTVASRARPRVRRASTLAEKG